MPATKKPAAKTATKKPAVKTATKNPAAKPSATEPAAKTATKRPAPAAADDAPVIAFATPAAWGAWLAANHATSRGVWMKLAKKHAGVASVTYSEALDVALAWGWIDGQKNRFDDDAWLQKFTPRRARSLWSKINRDRVDALVAKGAMQPPGLAEVARAKADGRWDAAYDPPSRATVPEDLAAALAASPRAAASFAALGSRDRYGVLFRVQAAKRPETRARRIAEFVAKLARGEKPHP